MKLLIATPAYDPMLWLETYAATVALDKGGLSVDCYCPQGHSVAKARTLAAQRALDTDSDLLLFVDSDNVLPKDALRNLFSHGVDVCFGYYQGLKSAEGVTCLYHLGDRYERRFTKDELRALRSDGEHLVEVRGGGMGCCLIRTDVFRRVPEPWFEYVWNRTGQKLSEDYWFCSRCRESGITLYADTRVECGHVRPEVV